MSAASTSAENENGCDALPPLLTEGVAGKMPTDDEAKQAELCKAQANEAFKHGKYDAAIELYTKAVDLNPHVAVYYGNRSIAYLKEELYGSSLQDADAAIQLDNKYVKAYYRRAAANMALGKFKKALKDYETVVKVHPKDPDATRKRDDCRKIVQRQAFLKAIESEEPKSGFESLELDSLTIEDDYTGASFDFASGVTLQFMKDLMEGYKNQQKLHKKYAYKILVEIFSFFKTLPTLVDIKVPSKQKFTICGDVHGQFYDLMNIFDKNGLPSETNPYLFNGDFVDRGSFSVETIFTLFGFKLLYPKHFFMSRGNHESSLMNQMYGFEGEVKAKYTQDMAGLFTEIFNHLPLCHCINHKILVMHGGLFSKDGVTLDDIRQTHRVRQPPDSGIMSDLLWSDPQELPGRSPSKRGVGIQFGADVTKRFCDDNKLQYIVRSHEVKPEGYEVMHDGRCVTVFSAPNYCDTMGNKGAYITITGDNLAPQFTPFDSVPHPQVRPMAYASNLFSMFS